MQFAQLLEGRLIKRYKRFLADIELSSGELITAHCPNTGSMRRCQQENARVWVSKSDNPKRKLAYTWELVEVDGRYLACVNTALPNKIVGEALDSGAVQELNCYSHKKAEVKYGTGSRIDWLLSDDVLPLCYVEVKNVTLLEGDGQGYFPDAVTDRGRKHLYELAEMVKAGHRAVLLFCVSHTGIESVKPAAHIDAKYTAAIKEVANMGVEVLAYQTHISTDAITLAKTLPVDLSD